MSRLIASVVLALSMVSLAQGSEALATKVCDRATPSINHLIDFAQTECAPGRSGSSLQLMVITSQAALDTAFHRKAYLIVVVGALGKALDDVGTGTVKEVVIMDRHLGAQRKYLAIPAKEVLRISRAARQDKFESLDALYAAIERSVRTEAIPAKK